MPSYLEETTNQRPGILGWVTSLDHKRIGVLYLASLTTMFFFAVSLGVMMRIEHLRMGGWFLSPAIYNAVFTLHGVIQIFLFVIPGLPVVFGNFFLPIMIGAKDLYFPRLNLLSWYMYIAGAATVLTAIFLTPGGADTGWTFYTPFSLRTGTHVSLELFGIVVLGFSSIISGINFVATTHRLRAPGMGWHQMPLFVWSVYATAWVQVLVTPIIASTFVLVMIERYFHIAVFDPAMGGDPLMYEHLFWTYSHPAVYIMILPAMGAVTEVFPTFAHRTVFGYRNIAYSSLAIAFLGSTVWGHHMFTSGMANVANAMFSFATFMVAVPSAIKVFNWTATLHKGAIELTPAMLYALTFIFLFSIGGLSGIIQGALAINVMVHDTYWVVAHFHYVMFGGTGFGFFAALLYWFPKMFGRMYNRTAAYVAWFPLFFGFLLFYFTFFILGLMGMPRRYFDHLPQFQTPQVVASIGAFIMVTGLLIFFINLIVALFRGKRAPANPWGGVTLEWATASPPPLHNFEETPIVSGPPYVFNPGREKDIE